MRGRTLLIFMSLLALVVVAPGAAVAKPGGTDRPFKGSGSGTTTFDLTTLTGTSLATARYSHLGKTSITQTLAVTPTADPTTFSATGTSTLVAANGDEFSTTVTGTLTVTPPLGVGDTFQFTLFHTVSGGTGRFADASGSFTVTGTGLVTSVVGTTQTSSQTFTTQGTISY